MNRFFVLVLFLFLFLTCPMPIANVFCLILTHRMYFGLHCVCHLLSDVSCPPFYLIESEVFVGRCSEQPHFLAARALVVPAIL